MMLLRARTLALGYSGVHRRTIEAILGLLNAGITPVVPEHGSLGASGDLAPLAHFSLALLGQGEVTDADGQLKPAGEALQRAGLEPITLGPKEGLSLINGTDGMLGMLSLACIDLLKLCRTADIAAAMSVEALLGTDTAFDAAVQALRPHAGQAHQRRKPRAADGGLGDRRLAPRERRPRPGRLFDALRAAGGRRRARRARVRARRGSDRARLGSRQPERARRRPAGVQRQLPWHPARVRRRLHGDRRGRGRRDRRAAGRPAARRDALDGAARHSSARARGSIPG